MRVVFVCTGNICRSPLGEQALSARLADFAPVRDGRLAFGSAGTHAEIGQPMPEEAAAWSRRLGGDPEPHAASFLTEATLRDAGLVLAMERSHRTRVVGLVPSLLRRTFTLREFARLMDGIGDEQFSAALRGPFVEADPESRIAAMLGVLADARSMLPGPENPGDDDVVDPYRRAPEVYALAASQIAPGVEAAARLLMFPPVWQD